MRAFPVFGDCECRAANRRASPHKFVKTRGRAAPGNEPASKPLYLASHDTIAK
jgi:hypothetical protein